jgi:protein-S-isoprenylcysteine O-methyltransferase Ste14
MISFFCASQSKEGRNKMKLFTRKSGTILMIVGVAMMLLNALLDIWFPNVDGIDIFGFLIAVVGLILTIVRWKH